MTASALSTASRARLRTKKIPPEHQSVEILRSMIFHTPRNPFVDGQALTAIADGALAIRNGRIAACGDYIEVRAEFPDAVVRDMRDGCILPGLVDCHVHFPQSRIIGGLGYSLLDWLETITLPEEARMADAAYARILAREFTHGLVSHGTTTALVFGSHFAEATAELFRAAEHRGIRVIAGLVLSDRMLRPELHRAADSAYADCKALIHQFHGCNRLSYAVTPRFALSASEPILEVCQTLLRETHNLTFTTHMNESQAEIAEVARLFPSAPDYLGVYEKFDLLGRHSLLAHNVHTTDSELARMASRKASVVHCPCSNAALGSGIFPMRRHLSAGVHFSLGTDVGGGTGFGVMKEALQSYLLQRLAPEAMTLTAEQLLWLATGAGAQALSMESEIGDFVAGKAADLVYIKPASGSTLHCVLPNLDDPERILTALFTLAGQDSIAQVRVEGDVVFEAKP